MNGEGRNLGKIGLATHVAPVEREQEPSAHARSIDRPREARVVWVTPSVDRRASEPALSLRRFDVQAPELIKRLGVELLVELFVLEGQGANSTPAVRSALFDITALKFGAVLSHFLPELDDLCARLGSESGPNMGLTPREVLKDEGMRKDAESLMINIARDDGTENVRILPIGPRALEALKAYRMLGDAVFRRAMPNGSQRIGEQLQYLVPEDITLDAKAEVVVPIAYSPKFSGGRLDYEPLAWRSLREGRTSETAFVSGEVPATITSRIVTKDALRQLIGS